MMLCGCYRAPYCGQSTKRTIYLVLFLHHVSFRFAVAASVALIGVAASCSSFAQSKKEEYELQERCGKRAEEQFRRDWGSNGVINTKEGQVVGSYRNHYNRKLNKCFVLLTSESLPYKEKTPRVSRQITLYDINESKDYGLFIMVSGDARPLSCQVAGTRCQSESEWDALVAPYMEE